MKILLTMHLPYVGTYGGANKCNRILAEALVKRGHTVHVVVPAVGVSSQQTLADFRRILTAHGITTHSEAGVEVFTLDGVEVHAVTDSTQIFACLQAHIRHFEPDWTLVSCEDWTQRLLDTALQAAPERVIYLVHTLLYLPFGPQAFFPSPQRSQLLQRAAGIVAVSHFVQNYLHTWGGLVSHVFHWPAYGPGPYPLLGHFDNRFVTFVNPSAGKGLAIFLALAEVFPEIQFAAVSGWGTTAADRTALEKLPNVHLLEPREPFDAILAQTRLLLFPSLWQEAFGLTVVEAMLRGIPVLASNVGGVLEGKLGTDFVLPVQPIAGYTEQFDDKLLPVPIIPAQRPADLDQWHAALRALTTDRAFYDEHATAARTAAQQFVTTLSFAPFEALLSRLDSQRQKLPSSVPSRPTAPVSPRLRRHALRCLTNWPG